ncbi:phospho-sugar mutase [Mesoplasma syrphidae]|uniref:Phospho-sugar mutase n=1 Tax=Mesoplasma syrphidae TaxID=225999 RepID=A0A2K9BKU7_9MOLU|nr:phospho-sugar mutase [Mesoplasma syrphidae]AUF83856.1 phospho-sugar mutase [Mesoplasma syrphidae]
MIYYKNNPVYKEWMESKSLEPQLKRMLQNASEEELFAAFNLELEFGTAGIRGILGAGPGRFNLYTIRKVTISYANLLIKKHFGRLKDGVVIGHDNRHNSAIFAQEVANILTSFGITAYLFEDNKMKPTPVVSFATKALNCIGGVVITASHNPAEYNGYKIYDQFGCQLMPEDTDIIAAEMNKISNIIDWKYTPDIRLLKTVNKEITNKYLNMICNLEFYQNHQSEKKMLKIVFSAVNGTGTEFTPVILKESGYEVIEVAEHAYEDPTFEHVVNPNPEFDPAWKIPLQYGAKHNADLIILNDPDADRIGIAVKHNNKFYRLDGNQTGPILIDWKLKNLVRTNQMPINPVLYSSFVTSDLGDRIAHETYQTAIVKTLTGFKWMGNEMAKESVNGLNFVFAYEESYGYVLDPSTRDKDGIQASIMIAEACWFYKKQGQTLIDYLNELFLKYGYYYTETINLNFKPEEKDSKIDPLMTSLRTDGLKQLNNLKVIKTEDYLDGLYNMPGQDLVKYYFEDGSWLAVRPSGTEPKLKIYFVTVGQNEKEAQAKTKTMYAELKKKMNI